MATHSHERSLPQYTYSSHSAGDTGRGRRDTRYSVVASRRAILSAAGPAARRCGRPSQPYTNATAPPTTSDEQVGHCCRRESVSMSRGGVERASAQTQASILGRAFPMRNELVSKSFALAGLLVTVVLELRHINLRTYNHRRGNISARGISKAKPQICGTLLQTSAQGLGGR